MGSRSVGDVGRRSLLLGLGSFALIQVIHACGLGRRSPRFVVEFLASSIPASLLKRVESQLQANLSLKLTPVRQLTDSKLATQILTPEPNDSSANDQANISLPNLTSLGDGWLSAAIQSQHLQPLMLESQAGWQQLPPAFQRLVRRDDQGTPDDSGTIWAAPYRWGQLMIAYRADKLEPLGWTPTNWDSLWDEPIRRRLSLPDHERLVVGLCLKALGQSVNHPDLDAVNKLTERLALLQQQVKFYSSDNYLQPLFLEDTWVAVGWSTDVLPVVQRDPRIKAIVPASGTILTADLWVQPRQADPETNFNPEVEVNIETEAIATSVQDWINFFWEPDAAIQLSLLSSAASPIILDADLAPNTVLDLPTTLTNNPLLMPSAEILNQSEFIEPLKDDAIAQYQQYWRTMRTKA